MSPNARIHCTEGLFRGQIMFEGKLPLPRLFLAMRRNMLRSRYIHVCGETRIAVSRDFPAPYLSFRADSKTQYYIYKGTALHRLVSHMNSSDGCGVSHSPLLSKRSMAVNIKSDRIALRSSPIQIGVSTNSTVILSLSAFCPSRQRPVGSRRNM